MLKIVTYDDAAYHEGAPAFVTNLLNPHNSGTHIGMYIAWIILSRLESFQLRQTVAAPVEEVRGRLKTGRELLFTHLDGKLTSEALNQEAKLFTEFYYEQQYLNDYHDILVTQANGTYTVVDSWANYDRIAVIMDQRLRDYRGNNPSVKPAAAS